MSIDGYDPKENKYECLGSSNSFDIEDMFNTVEHFQAMVAENDPQAKAIQYKAVSKVSGQSCGNCAVYQGKLGSTTGPCPLLAGKQVSAKGWCPSWHRKA
jgi:hypothetical protein